MTQSQRPQLTLKIMLFALVDVAGMIFFATGALWLAKGQSLFIPDFPSSMMEALAALIGGLLLMLWAAARILHALIKRPANNPQKSP